MIVKVDAVGSRLEVSIRTARAVDVDEVDDDEFDEVTGVDENIEGNENDEDNEVDVVDEVNIVDKVNRVNEVNGVN